MATGNPGKTPHILTLAANISKTNSVTPLGISEI